MEQKNLHNDFNEEVKHKLNDENKEDLDDVELDKEIEESIDSMADKLSDILFKKFFRWFFRTTFWLIVSAVLWYFYPWGKWVFWGYACVSVLSLVLIIILNKRLIKKLADTVDDE